jgi:rod shape determining protein RodA
VALESADVRSFAGQMLVKLRASSTLLTLVTGGLIATGLLFIYGIGQQNGGGFTGYWIRQLVWIGLGGCGAIALALTDYRKLGRWSWLIYLVSLGLLVAVLIPGIGREINGASSWIVLGPATLQPSETAKFGLIIMMAYLASRPYVRFERLRALLPFAIVAGIPMMLIGLQPDYGSAMVLIPLTVVILFVSGLPIRWLAIAGVICLLLAPPIYYRGLADHQRKRILVFLNPSRDLTGAGWNARQSLLAVGSGGIMGKGYMNGTQNMLGFLPSTVAPTDFIFSVIGEETGFVGSCLLLGFFAAYLILCVYVAGRAPDRFGRNLACGIAALIATHLYVNVGMTIGMAPVIGIPLPYVSYGGSFMIVMMACFGLLQSIYIHRDTDYDRS